MERRADASGSLARNRRQRPGCAAIPPPGPERTKGREARDAKAYRPSVPCLRLVFTREGRRFEAAAPILEGLHSGASRREGLRDREQPSPASAATWPKLG